MKKLQFFLKITAGIWTVDDIKKAARQEILRLMRSLKIEWVV